MTHHQARVLLRRSLLFVSRYRALLLLLGVTFLLRIPSLFEPHRYADEEIYLTLGQGLRRGLVFYRDIHDNKPPLLYLIAALAGDLVRFRIILLIVHAVGVVFFFKLSEMIFHRRHWMGIASTWVFALGSTLPFLEGNIANGENFMIVPALGGAYLLYRALRKSQASSGRLFFSVGILFALAFLVKIPIAFDFLGLMLFSWLLADPDIRMRPRLRLLVSKQLLSAVVGFLLPVLFSIAYYSMQGAFEPYVRSALLQNIGYVSTWRGQTEGFGNPLLWRGMILICLVWILYLLRGRLSFPSRFLSIWIVFSTYGALLASRPYPHYLLEPLVPFSLLMFLPFSAVAPLNRFVPLALLALVILAAYENNFWYYPTISYYKNFVRFAMGSKSREAYLDFWGVRRNYAIASYLDSHTLPTERIFVWGTEPSIYTLSRRLPVGRYTVAYHIFDFSAFDETLDALRSTPPAAIVVIDSLDQFNELKSFLDERYRAAETVDGAQIFELRPPSDVHSTGSG